MKRGAPRGVGATLGAQDTMGLPDRDGEERPVSDVAPKVDETVTPAGAAEPRNREPGVPHGNAGSAGRGRDRDRPKGSATPADRPATPAPPPADRPATPAPPPADRPATPAPPA